MFEIKKEIEIKINGEDVQTLKNICEMARVYIRDNKRKDDKGIRRCPAYALEEFRNIEEFLDQNIDGD